MSIIVKTARKLLNRMLALIKTEVPYHTNYSLNHGKETLRVPQGRQENTND